jgi:uncharacterized protein YjbI with pentapeptide repeats
VVIKFRLKELIAIKERKEGRKVTYRDINKATGINLNTITAMANNDMSMVGLSTMERLTDYFNCNIADLMIKEKAMNTNLTLEQFTNTSLTRDQVIQIVKEARKKGKAANLRKANLSGVDLSETDLIGTDFSNANLTGADLSRANLTGVNLSSANLTQANLSAAKLNQAILVWANLSEANLTDTDLSEADLYEATVSDEQLNTAN